MWPENVIEETEPTPEIREDDPAREDDHYVHWLRELREHLPFSILAVLLALSLFGIVHSIQTLDAHKSSRIFHVFHPIHLLLSAAATTSVFWTYEKKVIKSVLVGFFGSTIICSISDILLPMLGAHIFLQDMHLHICLLEEPELVLPFLVLGIFVGIFSSHLLDRASFFSHSGHVLVSAVSSLLYLTSYGVGNLLDSLGWILVLLVFAVLIPCCLSDLVLPVLFARTDKGRQKLLRHHLHSHHH